MAKREKMIVEKNYLVPFPPKRVYAAWVSSSTVIAPATAMDINPMERSARRVDQDDRMFPSI